MKTKQKKIAEKLGISESYLSLVLNHIKPISRPLAEKLSILFPEKDFGAWRKAKPHKIIEAFEKAA